MLQRIYLLRKIPSHVKQIPAREPEWLASLRGAFSQISERVARTEHSTQALQSSMAVWSDTAPLGPTAVHSHKRALVQITQDDTDTGSGTADGDGDVSRGTASLAREVQLMIEAMRDVLNISDIPPEQVEEAFFTDGKKTPLAFPAFKELNAIFEKAWENPEKKFQISKRGSGCFSLPGGRLEKNGSPPPIVDASVSRLSNQVVLPVPGSTALKDPADRKVDATLKSVYTASGAILQPTIACAWISKAIAKWSITLQEDLTTMDKGDVDLFLRNIQDSAGFLVESMKDQGSMAAGISMSVSAHRGLWLRQWSADVESRKSVESLPYTGQALFGEALDAWIATATAGKSPFLPLAAPATKKPFSPNTSVLSAH
ncbi:uncharacterized protein LOC134932974 [Pseudophryne corroboree]|uniref:uncharacterized protein LOC134932974 n=1 Tax=Pseudophryne corroboree TaxID=495146 RepID=UPI003081CD00